MLVLNFKVLISEQSRNIKYEFNNCTTSGEIMSFISSEDGSEASFVNKKKQIRVNLKGENIIVYSSPEVGTIFKSYSASQKDDIMEYIEDIANINKDDKLELEALFRCVKFDIPKDIPLDIPSDISTPEIVDITPELESKSQPEEELEPLPQDVLDILKKWDELFQFYSFNNPEYSRACLHLLIGQIIRESRIRRSGTWTDPRISVLYLKPTFSGGSAGYDVVAKVGRILGLMVETIADTSDAALIGTVEKQKDDATGEMETVEIKGLMDKSKSNIVYWGEPSMMFKKNLPPFQVKLRNYIQMALNPIDSEESKITKILKYGVSHCDCECSLMLVTFNPTEIDDEILKSGFLQRFCMISKFLDANGRGANAIMDANSYLSKNFDSSYVLEEVLRLLKFIQRKFKEKTIFTMSEEAAITLRIFESQEFNLIKEANTTERTREHLNGIQASTTRKIAQFAMHHAAMRLDTEIKKEDIEYASGILKSQMDTVKCYLEDSKEHEFAQIKEDSRILKIRAAIYDFMSVNKSEEMDKEDVLNIIAKIFKYSKNKDGKHTHHTYKIYKSMLTSKTLLENKDKKVKFIDVELKISADNVKPETILKIDEMVKNNPISQI